ncbi:MAG: hypothetical protein LUE14_11270 [Clostridiales bacterium]|nr:hypothetical protein [Clostridiales bacterium]
MGTGFKGGASHYHSIAENISALKSNYKFSNGYFGDAGQGRSFTRNISSSNPVDTAHEFYDTAAYGGIQRKMNSGSGVYTKMSDGTILSYRQVSSSDGTPVVEINIRSSTDSGGVKYQKIHFIKGRSS